MVRPRTPVQRYKQLFERFLSSSAEHRRLLAAALPLVAAVRLGLCLVPFRRLERGLTTLNHRFPKAASKVLSDDLAWAVRAASRLVPAASCLTQALAAQWLLNRHGYATKLHIGFAKLERGPVAGHAWLECEGRIVTGDGPLTQFTPLTTLNR